VGEVFAVEVTCWQEVNEVLLVRVDVLTRGRRGDEKRMVDELERLRMADCKIFML